MQLHLTNDTDPNTPSEPVTPVAPAPESAPPGPGPATLADELGRSLLRRRHVMLTGEIDDTLAALVCGQLLVLGSDDTCGDPVVFMINSPGGSVDAGFAIYDTMQTLGVDVATVCSGLAASMGQFLLCAGTPGMRYAHRHSQILMHQPHGAVQGFATDIRIHADHFARRRKEMARLTAEHTGQPVERVVADADRDHWYDADEALEYGMVDHIVDGPLKLTRQASFSSPR
ncbi:MAG TPA: ATP-dependent Clp protease proteolytic subunit [Acidimicrobiia bacterium]|jgi:ATP-dependent Clp protease protease subunit